LLARGEDMVKKSLVRDGAGFAHDRVVEPGEAGLASRGVTA
jgi:hypothetical protein